MGMWSDERANGVAVSFDPIRGYSSYYYLNTQLGEDLVTNPDALSEPEEILLHRSGDFYEVLATSNQVTPGTLLMSDEQMDQLAEHLAVIHERFARLYSNRPFAIEIEFKITVDNILAIKQARPWVFSAASTTTTPTISLGGGGGFGGPPPGPTPSEVEFEWNVTRDIEALDSGHDTPSGMWSDDATLWLAHNGDGADDAIYAYDLESGDRLEDREFELDERNRAPRGVWSDRSTIWISDSGQEKLFAHDLATGEPSPSATATGLTALLAHRPDAARPGRLHGLPEHPPGGCPQAGREPSRPHMVEMKLPASSPVSGPLRLDVDGHHEVPNDGILTGGPRSSVGSNPGLSFGVGSEACRPLRAQTCHGLGLP